MSWTYTTLKTALQDFTENAETTFVNNLDVFIRQSEERIRSLVDIEYFRKNTTVAITIGVNTCAVPSDFLAAHSLSITSSGTRIFLIQKDVEYLQDYNASGASGVPRFYSLYDVDSFIISPVPVANYTANLQYFYKPDSIITSTTSWIGDNAEEALFYGALIGAYIFMKGEADILATYEKRFTEAILRLKNYGEGKENVDSYREGLVRVKAN